MFKGYRTYLTMTLLFLVQGAAAFDWFSPEQAEILTNLLLGGGLVFLRAGIANK